MLPRGVFLWDERSVALPEEKPNKPSRRANACPQIEGSVTPPPDLELGGASQDRTPRV